MSSRDRLKQQIERYVTILRPRYERKTGGMVDLQAMDKPSSTPPTSDAAVRLMTHPDNVNAARRLESILNDMAMNFAGNAPFIYVQCLAAAGWRESDPGLVTAWRAGATEDQKILAQVFDEALDYVADIYVTRYGSEPLRVVIRREDEPCSSPREAADRQRTWDKYDTYLLVGAEIARVLEEEDVGGSIEAAKALVAQRPSVKFGTPCGSTRINDAWAHFKEVTGWEKKDKSGKDKRDKKAS